MKRFPFLNLKLANAAYAEEIKEAVCRVIDSGRYLCGDETAALESEIAQLCQVEHCVAVSNGLDALSLIIRAYKEEGIFADGDEIIVPANTYIASVLAITRNGLMPRFVDANAATLNLDTSKIEEVINARTRGIMPVHLYGTPCWDSTLKQLAECYNLVIIEDNAQAIGAKASCPGLHGTYATGSLGNAAGLSFYPTKNLGALGDAGAVTTHNPQIAKAVRALANYGSDRRYHNVFTGYNCRIDEIQAAALRVKLRYLDKETKRRREVAETYNREITNPIIGKPTIFADMQQVWHQYPICIDERDEFREYLRISGIDTDVHYATPPYLQPCYAEFSHLDMPVTASLARRIVSLPIGAPVNTADATTIARIINGFDC